MNFSFARATLMTATTAGLSLALGCSPSATDATVEQPSDPEPTATSLRTASTSTSTSTSTSKPPAPDALSAEDIPEGCQPERHCRGPLLAPESSGTGPPPEPGPLDLSQFDANGCLPRERVGNVCNGMRAYDGPTFTKGECCYTICRFPVPCGRPLVVAGATRVAPDAPRTDWCGSGDTIAIASAESRDAWRADAAMEHASVASFASLALSLLRWGAPATLIADAHRAALDEIAHAKLCYALASADPEGPPVGPGPLDVSDLALATTLADLAASTVREGCIGEAFAAVAAARAREGCEHLGARDALTRIAADELEHAALAFRVVAWALTIGGGDVRAAVEDAIRDGLAAMDAFTGPDPADPGRFRAAGRLERLEIQAIAREAREHLLAPCFAHLLGEAGARDASAFARSSTGRSDAWTAASASTMRASAAPTTAR